MNTLYTQYHKKGSVALENASTKNSIIQITNLGKNYTTAAGNFEALKGINLDILPGEITAIVGKSGSGKSTLMNMIAGIDKPTSGEIKVDGKELKSMKENQMAKWRGKSVGIVFQFFQLLPTLSVIENILLPMDFSKSCPQRERKNKAMELLKLVKIEEQAYKFPTALSGGQQQRAAIARALANNPSIILADEPTGNLDSTTAKEVFDIFGSLSNSGKTIIIVTHDMDIASRCSRIVRINDGLLA